MTARPVGPALPGLTLVERYIRRVDARGPDECWPWDGSLFTKGYGQFWTPDGPMLAHRYGYSILVGRIPWGHDVHHKCGSRNCQNPDHWETLPHDEHGRLSAHHGHGTTEGHTSVPESRVKSQGEYNV